MGSILLSFAILCILGTAQAECELSKQTMDTIIITQERKCCDRTVYLYDSFIDSALDILSRYVERKACSIQLTEDADRIFKRCYCGRDFENKRCQDELIEIFKQLRDDQINYLNSAPHYFEVLRNATEVFTQSAGEMRYYCKDYTGPEKLEYYDVRYIENNEVCKEQKYSKEAKALMDFIPGYLSRLRTTAVLLDVCVKNMKEIVNLKEYIPKDGECNDYKLLELLDITAALFARQLPVQVPLNGADGLYVISNSQKGFRSLSCCGKPGY